MERIQTAIDQIQQNINQLNGAINAQIEQARVTEARLARLENPVVIQAPGGLVSPRTEDELNAISRLPDCVKDLQTFEGSPIHYISWIHNVESILKDYEIVRDKPIYRAIVKHIRQKVRGAADNALISYNIFDAEWSEIKKCLSIHYADKRDIQSLENQLLTMHQGRDQIDHFYNKVNHQLSLIINKIKTEDYSDEGMTILIKNYRQRALDVFIRGLHQNVAQLVKIQKPNTLPEAYSACLELQNMNFRKNMNYYDPAGQMRNTNISGFSQTGYGNSYQSTQLSSGRQFSKLVTRQPTNSPPVNAPNNTVPPRPFAPKPPVPMEVDPSLRSERINYMNRPMPVVRHSNESSNIPRKAQRMFNIETQEENDYLDTYESQYEDDKNIEQINESEEVNFMTEASPEYLT